MNGPLVQAIEAASSALVKPNCNARPLRELHVALRQQLSSDCPVADLSAQAFLLDTYLQRVFLNLVGDVPYIEGRSPEIQERFLRETGQALGGLAAAINSSVQDDSCLAHWQRLTESYFTAVRDLDRAIQEHRRPSISKG